MIVKNIPLNSTNGIIIGKRGENEATQIVWDISTLVSTYGNGTALALAKRSTDEAAYPVAQMEQTESAVTWTVTNVDTNYLGRGQVELFWYVGGTTLAKSYLWPTLVLEDITGVIGDAPDAYESWLDTLDQKYAEQIEAAKEEVRNAEAWAVGERDGEPVTEGDPTYENNSRYWAGEASDAAANAEGWADRAEQAANEAGYMGMEINADGELIYTRTDAVDVDFVIDASGRLIMEAV